jgi:hypothetical protein
MPLDTIIDYPCRPKRELGGGDLRAGTRALVELLRVKATADAVRAVAVAAGRPADDATVKIVLPTADGGSEEQTHTVRELDERTAVLDPHVPACTNCPVNGLRRPFGCINSVAYPVRKAAERWLLDRVQPPNTIGGALLLQAIAENGYDGEHTRGYRAAGKFQAFPAPERELPKNAFEKEELSGDELFQPLLLTNGRLAPWQCLHVLLWFGAVKADDAVPLTAADALKLTRMEPAERAKRARLNIGISGVDPGVDEVRNLLKTLFAGWVRDVPVLVDS